MGTKITKMKMACRMYDKMYENGGVHKMRVYKNGNISKGGDYKASPHP